MAFIRINYFYKVVLLITLSLSLYLITNQYLVDDGRNVRNDLGAVRIQYSVVVSSSSVHNGEEIGRASDAHNGPPNEFSRGQGEQNGNQRENNEAHQPKDWFQSFREQAMRIITFLTPDTLYKIRDRAVETERENLRTEMERYMFVEKGRKFEDLIMEKGGEPIRNIVFTTWRSGSTFLGDLVNSHPATYYHYEPLLPLEIVQVRSGELAKKALDILRAVLNCRYSSEYVEYGEDHWWFHMHNRRLSQFCESNHEVCWDAKFISKMCKLFPFQSMKTVKMRLRLAEYILEDPKLNVRLLYFIRDPRGTMQSRHHRDWCPGVPDCDSPRVLCSDLEDDYYAAKLLRKRFPKRFLALRYEDFSMNVYSGAEKLFKFFRLQFHQDVQRFLDNHTKVDIEGLYSITRNSKTAPFHWRNDFENNFEEVQTIQSECTAAMSLWGYKMANNKTHMQTFEPVGPPVWSEMVVTQDQDNIT